MGMPNGEVTPSQRMRDSRAQALSGCTLEIFPTEPCSCAPCTASKVADRQYFAHLVAKERAKEGAVKKAS